MHKLLMFVQLVFCCVLPLDHKAKQRMGDLKASRKLAKKCILAALILPTFLSYEQCMLQWRATANAFDTTNITIQFWLCWSKASPAKTHYSTG